MSYHGDIAIGQTVDIKFSTVNGSGVPTTLAGTPAVAAYPGNSTTELTAGITLTVDFDATTGLHNVRVVASGGNGYATATDYTLVITAGTVDGSSVVGYVVGSFSIENRALNAAKLATDAVNEIRDAILSDSTAFAGANVDAAVSSRAIPGDNMGLTAAGADAVWDEAMTEPSAGQPPATPTFRALFSWFWVAWRNLREQTNAEGRIHNDAGTVLAERDVSDDTVTTQAAKIRAAN